MATSKKSNSRYPFCTATATNQWMDRTYKQWTMRERRGSVRGWLDGKSAAELSDLIDSLKSTAPYKAQADAEVRALTDNARR